LVETGGIGGIGREWAETGGGGSGRHDDVDPSPLRDVLTVGLGVLTGMMSGAFGVGGAVLSTPGIRALGATPIESVGSTLPSILPSAISGTLKYSRAGLVDWRVVALTTPAGMLAAVGGAVIAPRLPGDGHPLMVITAILLLFSGLRMARRPAAHTVPAEPLPASAAVGPTTRAVGPFVATGVLAGGLSGLLGIGGGVVMVPVFTQWTRLPLKLAIGTSLVCVGLFAIPGTITHAVQGDIDWRFALLLCVGVIPGARLGASLALRTTDHRLRLVVGTFLSVLALIYGAGEIVALF
jgi:uncharacterized protein